MTILGQWAWLTNPPLPRTSKTLFVALQNMIVHVLVILHDYILKLVFSHCESISTGVKCKSGPHFRVQRATRPESAQQGQETADVGQKGSGPHLTDLIPSSGDQSRPKSPKAKSP